MLDTRIAQDWQNRASPHGTSMTPARGAMRHIWQQSSEADAAAAVADSAQIPLRRLSPTLPRGESRRRKSRKSGTQTISTCRDVCHKVRDKSATNPFIRSNGM